MSKSHLKVNEYPVESTENTRIEYVDSNSGMKVIVNYNNDNVESERIRNRVKELIKKAYGSKIFD